MVVRQQLHFDVGWANKCQGNSANVGRHGRQSQLDPQLALQVQIAHQHWQLQPSICLMLLSSRQQELMSLFWIRHTTTYMQQG